MGGTEWRPIASAPKDATTIEVRLASGEILEAHWACDYSGEHQAAFDGWFKAATNNRGFVEIDTPKEWRPISKAEVL